MPSFRRTGVGTALLLERQPAQGLAGAAIDLARVIAGRHLYALPRLSDPVMAFTAFVWHCACQAQQAEAHAALPPAAGTRLLGSALAALLTPQPPAATLATQLVLAALIHNSPGYCSTPLLTAPLVQHRTALLAAGLEVLAAPLVLVLPPALYPVMMASMSQGGRVPAYDSGLARRLVCCSTVGWSAEPG